MANAEAYAAPTPRVLYIHNDLSEYVCRQQGEGSPARQLTQAIFMRVRCDPGRVVVLTLESQIEGVLAQGTFAPFARAIGIGRAGERVAQHLHAKTGWFPKIARYRSAPPDSVGHGMCLHTKVRAAGRQRWDQVMCPYRSGFNASAPSTRRCLV